jgi:flagellar protein FliO/FliZ
MNGVGDDMVVRAAPCAGRGLRPLQNLQAQRAQRVPRAQRAQDVLQRLKGVSAIPLLLCSALAALPALAQQTPRVGSAAPVVDAAQFLRLAFALALVVGLIYLCAWLLRRVQGFSPGAHSVVRVLGSASIGQRERAVLVQVGEQQLLLGVAPGSVRTLHTFAEPVVSPEQLAAGAGGLAAALPRVLQRGQGA